MKLFLKNIASQLKEFSKTLDKQSLFVDQPWALIDDEFEMQKLIFKKDGKLVMAKNGKVTTGSWEYLSVANSLLIDRVKDKLLCKTEYVDKGVMILKLDGTDNRYFALANENEIPDLDVENYLNELRLRKVRIQAYPLKNGQNLEIVNSESQSNILTSRDANKQVFIDGEIPANGEFLFSDPNYKVIIKNGLVENILRLIKYRTKGKRDIYIDQKAHIYNEYGVNDFVYKDEDRKFPLEDGNYKMGLFKNIRVKNGRIV